MFFTNFSEDTPKATFLYPTDRIVVAEFLDSCDDDVFPVMVLAMANTMTLDDFSVALSNVAMFASAPLTWWVESSHSLFRVEIATEESTDPETGEVKNVLKHLMIHRMYAKVQ